MRRLTAALAILLMACSATPGSHRGRSLPPPRRPASPSSLAERLAAGGRALHRDLRAWLRPASKGPLPTRRIELEALAQQNIYGELVAEPRRARRILMRLPPSLRSFARANLRAGRDLAFIVGPISTHAASKMKVRSPLPPPRPRAISLAAQRGL